MAVTAADPVFKVAIIQMRPKVPTKLILPVKLARFGLDSRSCQPLDAEHNFAHAAKQIRLGAAQGVSLAVLPEYHLTGWVPEEPSFALNARDARRFVQRYQDLAAELHINICTGTIVSEAPKHTDQAGDTRPTLLNTSHFVDHNGHLLGDYTKTNLWITERQTLTSSVDYARHSSSLSNPHQVFDTPIGPVGILVCWDLAFPEAFRQLVLRGAKIIIIPSYWTSFDMCGEGLAYNKDCEKLFVQSTLVARAFENTAAVIYCNAGGPANEGFFGCSQVVLPIVGTVPGSFMDGSEEMRVLDVDMRTVEVAERNYKVREDLRKEDWHYGYAREPKNNDFSIKRNLDTKPML